MPLLTIKTNHTITDKNSFALEASQLAAKILGKPESYVMVNIDDKQTLVFASSNLPAAYLELKSLGLPEAETTDLSSSLCAFINETLGIDAGRIYIEFSNAERHMWGWKGGTF